jgi:translocation and assembly module TamB
VKKRRLALVLLVVVLALVAGTVAVLRTRWAGQRLCALAAERVKAATGLPVTVAACRIEPLSLRVVVEGLVVGPPEAPVFTAEVAQARLEPVQGFGRRVELAEVSLTRPRLVLSVAGPAKEKPRCPPEVLDRLDVARLTIADGGAEVTLAGGGRLAVDGLGLDARRTDGSAWRLGPAPRSLRVAAAATRVEVATAGQGWHVVRPALEGVVALDLSALVLARAEAQVGGARLGLRGSVKSLCAPVFDLTATAEGSLPALVALAGASAAPWDGEVAAEARLEGTVHAPKLGGSVRFEHLRHGRDVAPGAGRATWRWAGDRILVDALELPFGGGRITATGSVKLQRDVAIEVAVKLEDVELGELLERLSVPGAWVTGRFDGAGRLGGTVVPAAIDGRLELASKGFRSLAGPWRAARPGDFTFLDFERGRLGVPFRIRQEGVYFDKARIEVGQGWAEVDAAVHFEEAKGFEVLATGELDLDALRHVAGLPWGGRAAVTARIGAAPYGNPRAEAHLKAERFKFLTLDLGAVSADLAYGPDYSLRLTGIQGQRGQTRYEGFATLDLGHKPILVTASRLTASGRLRDLFESVQDWLPSSKVVRDALDGRVEELTARASGRAAALDADFEGRLGPGEFLGRRFDGGRISGHIAAAAQASFDRVELQYGPGTVSATGRWTLAAPFPWDLTVALAGLPASALALPGGDWGGSLSGSATLGGSFEVPDVHFAVNGDALSVRGASLGTVQAAGTVAGRKLLLTGGADGVRFTGDARLEGRLPFHARAELRLEDAARLWPGGPPVGLKAAVEGEATAEGELEDLRGARARVRLERLSAGYLDLKLENAGPVELALEAGRLEVGRFAIRGANTEFSLTGAVGAAGDLALEAQGSLDLRLLGGVLPLLRRPHGRLALEAHVGGTVEAPVLLGTGRVDEAGFVLRGGQAAFEQLHGDLAFSQNKVLLDGLEAQVNGARVGMSGEVELTRLIPSHLRVEAQLDAVPVAVPSYLPATLSGKLEAAGTLEETVVTGRLHVLRARYTENVELEKNIYDVRRRRPPPPRAYDKAGEWLRFDLQLAVDGDARVENDLVRGGMRGDLVLTGSLAAPGLLGTLAMTEGSRAVFRGNEFSLSHAVVDFTDRNKLEMALDVHGEARVSDYQVFMHLFGTMIDPKVTLTSTPPLSQPDIITLLSMGFTQRDTQRGSGTQGLATAAAAQALFAASGLPEQVRRFLPRGGPVQDLSVRITSVYSEQTGQVEPRVEFESWALHEKLRLRFQTPLAGARGQRAQVELRLGDHTALQYQFDTDSQAAMASQADQSSRLRWAGDHGLDLKLRWEWTE